MNERPVYEYDQVITKEDITQIHSGYVFQYRLKSWLFSPLYKLKFVIGMVILETLLDWVRHGKPPEFRSTRRGLEEI